MDGSLSCRILIATLQALGHPRHLIHFFIPDRFTQGYGVSPAMIEFVRQSASQLLITADIGVTAHNHITHARSLGIDVIVCDHHLPDGSDVPTDATAVICPKGSSVGSYPHPHLAAVGVSLKLAEALLTKHPKKRELIASFAKPAAIGTIADMVDMSNIENRAIVKLGLDGMRETKNPGLAALLAFAPNNPLRASDLGFQIAPRINAAGRMQHANLVVELLETKTDATALAAQIDELNTKRKAMQENLTRTILTNLPGQLPNVLIIGGTEAEGFHKGVLGLVATKLTQETGRPSFVYIIADGMASGSARGGDSFHVVDALKGAAHLLIKYGGHPAAGGFTLRADDLPAFQDHLLTYASNASFTPPTFQIHDELSLSDCTLDLAATLSTLEPFGFGFPAPIFALHNYRATDVTILKEKHLRLTLTDGHEFLKCVFWNSAQVAEQLRDRRISVIGRPEINTWKGKRSIQFQILDTTI